MRTEEHNRHPFRNTDLKLTNPTKYNVSCHSDDIKSPIYIICEALMLFYCTLKDKEITVGTSVRIDFVVSLHSETGLRDEVRFEFNLRTTEHKCLFFLWFVNSFFVWYPRPPFSVSIAVIERCPWPCLNNTHSRLWVCPWLSFRGVHDRIWEIPFYLLGKTRCSCWISVCTRLRISCLQCSVQYLSFVYDE